MDAETIIQGGAVGLALVTLVILFFIVKYFVNALKDKDAHLIEMVEKLSTLTEKFTHTVSNHIQHSVEKQEEVARTQDKLTNAIDNLAKKINEI